MQANSLIDFSFEQEASNMATVPTSESNSGSSIANTTAIVESNPQCEASSTSPSVLSSNGSPQLNRYLQIDGACKLTLAARQEMDKHYNQTFERERKRHAKEIIDIRDKHLMCEQALKKKLESNEADYQRLLNDLNDLKVAHAKELRKLKDQIDDLKVQHDQDLFKKDAIIKDLKEGKHELQYNFDLKLYELKTVREELEDKTNEFQEVERLNLEEIQNLNKTITEIDKDNFYLKSQLETVNEEKRNLQQEIESIRLESKRLEELENEQSQTISQLTNELETNQRENEQIFMRLDEEKRLVEEARQRDLENHRQSVKSFTLHQAEREQQYKAKIQKLEICIQNISDETNKTNSNLKSQLNTVNEEKRNLQQEIESIRLESKRLEELENEQTQTISKLTTELETSLKENEQIRIKLEEEKRQIEEVRQQELENHRQSVESFTLKKTELEQQYKAKIEKLEMSLQNASEETNKIRINLEKKSNETEAYRNEMEKKYNQLVQDKETVLTELNRLEELNQKLSLNLNSTTVELEDYEKTLQIERSEKQEKMAELRHALEEIESSHEEIEKLKSTNLELQTMIDKNSEERTEMLKQFHEQRDLLIEVEKSRLQIKTKLSQSIMHIGKLETTLEEKDKQLNEMEAKQKNMEKVLEQSSNFADSLQQQQQANQHLQAEFEELQRKNTKLKSEYNSMRKHSASNSTINTMSDYHQQQSTSSADKSFSKSQMLELIKLLSESTIPKILSDSCQLFDIFGKFEHDNTEIIKKYEKTQRRLEMFENQSGKMNNTTKASTGSGSESSDGTSDYRNSAERLFDLNFSPLGGGLDSLEMEAGGSTTCDVDGSGSYNERLLKAQSKAEIALDSSATFIRNKASSTVNRSGHRAGLKSNVGTNTIAAIGNRLNGMPSDSKKFPSFNK